MTDTELEVYKKIWDSDSSPVLVYEFKNGSYSLLWRNSVDPPFDVDENLPKLLSLPENKCPDSGTVTYTLEGNSYRCHINAVDSETVVLTCPLASALEEKLAGENFRSHIDEMLKAQESHIADVVSHTSYISDMLEDSHESDDLWHSVNGQLNDIMIHCTETMKFNYLWSELLYYMTPDCEPLEYAINGSSFLQLFGWDCKDFIGHRFTTKINVNVEKDIYIPTSYEHFQMFLLCLIAVNRGDPEDMCNLTMSAANVNDENVITLEMEFTQRKAISLRKTSLTAPKSDHIKPLEQLIIKKFAEKYNCSIIKQTQKDKVTIAVRFNADSDCNPASMRVPPVKQTRGITTPVHAMLYEFSNFIFF